MGFLKTFPFAKGRLNFTRIAWHTRWRGLKLKFANMERNRSSWNSGKLLRERVSVTYQEHAATPFCCRSRIRAAVNNNSCCKSTRPLAVTYEYKSIKILTLMLDGETVKHKISKWTDLVINNYQGLHGNMKSICLTYLTRLRETFCLGWLYLPFGVINTFQKARSRHRLPNWPFIQRNQAF